jgi:hypothetical protein
VVYIGITVLMGKFSTTEIVQLDAAIEQYRVMGYILLSIVSNFIIFNLQNHNLTEEDIYKIIMHKGKNKRSAPFWAEMCLSPVSYFDPSTYPYMLTAAVAGQPQKQVHGHLQRCYNPSNKQGRWTSSKDKLLIQSVSLDYNCYISNMSQ